MEQQILDLDDDALDVRSRLAGKGVRFGNLMIDSILAGVPISLMTNVIIYGDAVVTNPYTLTLEKQMSALGMNIIFYIIYYIIMEHSFGKTIGKLITGTRVVNGQGQKPTLGQIIGRTFARYIPFEPFSYLGEDASGWHDSLSKTFVISEN